MLSTPSLKEIEDLVYFLDSVAKFNGAIEDGRRAGKFRDHWVSYLTEPHPTEQKYPEQTKRFREILDEMYQTHLRKNADYSAWNILGTGTIGLTVRFWDKAARLMNLMGFDIGTGEYIGQKKALVLDESILDTVNDATVYGIIWRIFSEGKWGR